MNESAVDFAVSLSKVDNHCGIVRGSRSDGKSKGIRFDKADYMTAFANLKPDEKPPLLVMANHHFKIAPTRTDSSWNYNLLGARMASTTRVGCKAT